MNQRRFHFCRCSSTFSAPPPRQTSHDTCSWDLKPSRAQQLFLVTFEDDVSGAISVLGCISLWEEGCLKIAPSRTKVTFYSQTRTFLRAFSVRFLAAKAANIDDPNRSLPCHSRLVGELFLHLQLFLICDSSSGPTRVCGAHFDGGKKQLTAPTCLELGAKRHYRSHCPNGAAFPQ